MNLFKEVTGKGKNVVLLHGWGCDHRHMQPIAELLSKHYRVSNYDLPGRGGSSDAWHDDIESIDDMADCLLHALPENAVYIGWSFGGLLSLSIASRYPERVERYIGICSLPKFIETDNWPAVAKPGFTAPFKAGLAEKGVKQFFQDYYDMEFEGVSKDALYDHLVDALDDADNIDLDILLQGTEICDSADLRKEFSSVDCPIDLILTANDHSAPAAVYDQVQALNPTANLHVMKVGQHLPFFTHPKEFNEILLSVLNLR